jgi:hypothetical protein
MPLSRAQQRSYGYSAVLAPRCPQETVRVQLRWPASLCAGWCVS